MKKPAMAITSAATAIPSVGGPGGAPPPGCPQPDSWAAGCGCGGGADPILAYRQARLQARLTTIEETRRREQVEARQHADVRATVAGTPTALQLVFANDGPATAWEVWATELPVGSDDPPLFHGLDELEQAPATLRPGDRLPFPVLTLAETAERVQVVVSWKDQAGPHRESFTVQLP
jgi:hypothetical protein